MSKTLIVIISFLLILGCCESKKNYGHELGILIKESETDKTKIDEAIQLSKTEYKNNPDSKMAVQQLISLYSNKGKIDSAQIYLTKLIEEDKKEIAGLYETRGFLNYKQNNYDKSIEDLENSIKYDGGDKMIYNQIIISKLWKKYKNIKVINNLKDEEILKIIEEVYPENMEKASVIDIKSAIDFIAKN